MATRLRLSLLVLAIGGATALVAAALVHRWLHAPIAPGDPPTLIVAPGESFAAVGRRLETRGVLQDARPIIWWARLTGGAREIRAGEYSIAGAGTALDVLDILRHGTPIQHSATLVEGWTVGQVLDHLAGVEALEHTLAGVDPRGLMEALGLPDGHAEGLFFPETYQFERGTADVELLRRAYRTMEQELDVVWQSRDAGLPLETPYELLILASLVEKETGMEQDRGKIARVFVSRLEQGMRLQTDPTVIYGLGASFDGNLTRAHLNTDGPYNTYRRAGLPPTPIAIPGRNSLEAAGHPEPGPYLYFVARGDGTSQFSVTLDEHLAAVRRYQLKRR